MKYYVARIDYNSYFWVCRSGSSDGYALKNKEYREDSENVKIEFEKISDSQDVIALMFDSAKELKEYYVISKHQAKSTFGIASLSCVLGFVIYIFGIISAVFFDKDTSLVTIVSGSVLELISGTTFWLYTKALTQLNTYHKRLEETEKYLIVHQMISEVPEEKRYDEQRNFINYVLNDNQEEIKSKRNKPKTEKIPKKPGGQPRKTPDKSDEY